jgi:WD40 repeat protein
VFVTGHSARVTSGWSFATLAYDAATGAQLWVTRHTGPDIVNYCPASMTVSPTGKQVFIAGFSTTAGSGRDYTTIAYDAATGAQQWVQSYNGPGNSWDSAYSVAVSPTGRTVYVTGSSDGATPGGDYATIAYDAATGAKLWIRRFNSRGNLLDGGTSVTVSPGGGRVYVTGFTLSPTAGDAYVTIAYRAATGAQLWIRRFQGPASITNGAHSLLASPPGGRVFVTMVTGDPEGAIPGNNYLTVAYAAATGARLWVKRYNGPANEPDVANSVAVSLTGKTVYVTGDSSGGDSGWDLATVAYDAATGAQLWAKRYSAPSLFDHAQSVAVSPIGGRVFVTGSVSGDYLTIAYSG